MRQALAAAEQAARTGEVPVGAVVVVGGEVVAVAHNERETKNDPTAHAEVVALRRAAAARGSWRLIGADLYVTMEPCPMCAGAIVNARLQRVIYGCDDPKAGAARTLYRLLDDPRLNHRVEVVPGVFGHRERRPAASLLHPPAPGGSQVTGAAQAAPARGKMPPPCRRPRSTSTRSAAPAARHLSGSTTTASRMKRPIW